MVKPEKYIRSDCRQFLYGYEDVWDANLPLVGFVMLAPGEAGDLSVSRCVTKARQLGGGGVLVVYLYPQLSPTQPMFDRDYMKSLLDSQLEHCMPVIACWGNPGALSGCVGWYLNRVKEFGYTMTLQTLGFDRDGHPLMVGDVSHATVPSVWVL